MFNADKSGTTIHDCVTAIAKVQMQVSLGVLYDTLQTTDQWASSGFMLRSCLAEMALQREAYLALVLGSYIRCAEQQRLPRDHQADSQPS